MTFALFGFAVRQKGFKMPAVRLYFLQAGRGLKAKQISVREEYRNHLVICTQPCAFSSGMRGVRETPDAIKQFCLATKLKRETKSAFGGFAFLPSY